MKTSVLTIAGAAVILLLAVASCSLEIPGVPRWTVEGTVPFSQRTYRLSELLTDNATFLEQRWGVLADPIDSLLRFSYSDSLDEQIIGDRIKYEASDNSDYVSKIGAISVDQPNPLVSTIEVRDLDSNLVGLSGPLPQFEFGPIGDTLEFNIFHWVAISDGEMVLTVENNFPFAIEELTIILSNLPDNDLIHERVAIDTVVFEDRIESGETAGQSISLDDKILINNIELLITGYQPDNHAQIEIVGDESMSISVQISDLEVDSTNAEISQQSFTSNDSMEIESENKIIEAAITSGSAILELENTTPFKLNVDITFENIRTTFNTPLVKRFELEPEALAPQEVLDLSDHTLSMDLNNQVLRISSIATIEDSRITRHNGTSYQTIISEQGLSISYRTTDFVLKSFEGILDSVRVEIPEMQTEVDIPKGLDNIQFTNAILTINLMNSIDAPVTLSIDVTGSNSATNRSVTLPVKIDRLNLGDNQIVVRDTVGLVGVFPDQITIVGWAGLGEKFFHDQSIVTVTEEQGISGTFQLDAGLQLVIDSTHLESDLTELDHIDVPLEGLEMYISLSNTLPISGVVNILLGNDSTEMDTIVRLDLPHYNLDEQLHRSVEPAFAEYTINIGPEQFSILNPDDDETPVYTRQFIVFNGSEGKAVWLYADDSLTVQASATVFYPVDLTGGEK